MVDYICAQCGATVPITTRDTVRCPQCNCMILYKKRTGGRIHVKAR